MIEVTKPIFAGTRAEIPRRTFLKALASGASAIAISSRVRGMSVSPRGAAVAVDEVRAGESLVQRAGGEAATFNETLYKQLLGAANVFKEGDAIVGVAAVNETSHRRARLLLSNTTIGEIDAHPLVRDSLTDLLRRDAEEVAGDRPG